MLLTNPLEEYYKADSDKRPDFRIGPNTSSSANWRGYVATWEIADNKLYLTKVASWLCVVFGEPSTCKQVELLDIFPTEVADGKVLADWYTGVLRVPDGKQLRYVHMGYGSTYERDLMFEVRAGAVSQPSVIDNTKIPLPPQNEAALRELEKLKQSALGNKPAFGPAKPKDAKTSAGNREPNSGITIVPGQGVFSVGTKRAELEAVIGDGETGSRYDDVYFVEYPKAGVQVSYKNEKDVVHVMFLYNSEPRYASFIRPIVKTDKGIDWSATPKDIMKAYGKPQKDFGDESPARSWRRLEYPGIDFRFEGERLVRIGILGPDGN
jgi:hypothetical protein